MHLRHIESVSFRSSEQTNFQRLPKEVRNSLRDGDVVLLISKGGDQLVFIHGFDAIDGGRSILHSERFRLTSGVWNPLMLANYAEKAGLKLDGLKRFEEYYQKLAGGGA